MGGNKDWFYDLDENYKVSVKLGDDSKIMVERKGNIKLEIEGIMQMITGVFFIPHLKNSLQSIGQLQEEGLFIVFEYM